MPISAMSPDVNRRGIDPAEIAVWASVNDIHLAASGTREYEAGGAGQVEFHHRLADRKPLQGRGGFRNDHRVIAGHLLVAFGGRPHYKTLRGRVRRLHP